jgi:hypothetical protein
MEQAMTDIDRYAGMTADKVSESICRYQEYSSAIAEIYTDYLDNDLRVQYLELGCPGWARFGRDHYAFGRHMLETYGIKTLAYHFESTRFFAARIHSVVDESLFLMFKLKYG